MVDSRRNTSTASKTPGGPPVEQGQLRLDRAARSARTAVNADAPARDADRPGAPLAGLGTSPAPRAPSPACHRYCEQ